VATGRPQRALETTQRRALGRLVNLLFALDEQHRERCDGGSPSSGTTQGTCGLQTRTSCSSAEACTPRGVTLDLTCKGQVRAVVLTHTQGPWSDRQPNVPPLETCFDRPASKCELHNPPPPDRPLLLTLRTAVMFPGESNS
jgi:hypothetical protein